MESALLAVIAGAIGIALMSYENHYKRQSSSDLDAEAQQTLNASESCDIEQSKDAGSGQTRHPAAAAATFRQDSLIDIRLPSSDIQALQEKALADGVLYQDLAARVLHQYVEERLSKTGG